MTNWLGFVLPKMTFRSPSWSAIRLCLLLCIAVWTFNLVTLSVMAQDTSSTPSANQTNTTASPANSNTSTDSASGNETTTVSPGPNTTPSGAASTSGSLLTSVLVLALNWFVLHKTLH